MTDSTTGARRVEAGAKAIVDDLDKHCGGGNWDASPETERRLARGVAVKVLAAADACALAQAEGVAKDIQLAIAPEAREATMRGWDMWRAAIAKDNAGDASWPRDAFESHLDSLYEPLEQAPEDMG